MFLSILISYQSFDYLQNCELGNILKFPAESVFCSLELQQLERGMVMLLWDANLTDSPWVTAAPGSSITADLGTMHSVSARSRSGQSSMFSANISHLSKNQKMINQNYPQSNE